jgi:hypothetical protein
MKILKHLSLSVALLLVVSLTVRAQGDITELLKGSKEDANTLGKAYLEPFGKGFGAGLNSGWYTTAKPHKLFGFDLTFTVTAAMPPTSAKTFDVNKLDLKFWELQTPANHLSPTVTGDKVDGPILVPQLAPGSGVELQLPQGAKLPFIPAPMIQAGIGLPFNTELDIRYLPTLKVPGGAGELSLFGFGIKNEFKEFIPGFKALPFNVSIFYGYTKFKSSFSAEQAGNANSNQKLNFDASGSTIKLLVSKSIPVLTVYAGAGYSKATTNVTLKGDYEIDGLPITDPIKLDFVNKGMSANVGLRLKLAVIAFHFDYTFGEYSLYNAGFGINFR